MIQHTNTRSCVGWSGHLPSLRGLVFVRGTGLRRQPLTMARCQQGCFPSPMERQRPEGRHSRCYGYLLAPLDDLCVPVDQHDKSSVHLCLSHLGRSPGCLCCAACISLSTTIEPKPTLTNSLRSTSVSSNVAASVTFPSCGVPYPSSEAQIFSESVPVSDCAT